jgi:hypothetical protein
MKGIFGKLANLIRRPTEPRHLNNPNVVMVDYDDHSSLNIRGCNQINKSSSESIGLEDATVLKDIENLLECPVCLTVPRGGTPIYECSNSHIICGDCAEKITEQKCPTCRVIFLLDKRNRIAEKLILKFDFEVPCIHTGQGCNHREKNSRIKAHEANCTKNHVECLVTTCGEIMNPDQLIEHSRQKHNCAEWKTAGNKFSYNFGIRDEDFENTHSTLTWLQWFFVLGGQTYIPILWNENGVFCVMVYILAEKEVAQKYTVTISITGKDFHMNYTTNVVPIITPIRDAKCNEKNSLALTNCYAKMCIIKDSRDKDVLSFRFKILES